MIITDYDQIYIEFDNELGDPVLVQKFNMTCELSDDGDYVYVYWNIYETGVSQRLYTLLYSDVTFGYAPPSSGAELLAILEGYIRSGFDSGPAITPTLEEVLTEDNDGGGLEITNIADGGSDTSAATVGQVNAAVAAAVKTITYPLSNPNYAPTDSVTQYFGNVPLAGTPGNQQRFNTYIRYAGTIKVVEIIFSSFSTIGSNESFSMYLRINDTTDHLIATVGTAVNNRVFSNTAINVTVAAGDFFTIKCVNPAWATNPVGVYISGYVYQEIP